MLPSKGLFKEEPCPFFENGCCERPYCHFRHKKPEVHHGELFSDYIASLDKIVENLPITKNASESYCTSSESSSIEILDVIERDTVNSSNIATSRPTIGLASGALEQSRSFENGNATSDIFLKTEANDIVNGCSADVNKSGNDGRALEANTNSKTSKEIYLVDISSEGSQTESLDKNVIEERMENVLINSNRGDNYMEPSDESKKEKLTTEQLRGIDEIVQLLKKAPQRIDFAARFLKTLVETEDKAKAGHSSSSHRSKSHSSRSHKSSRSSTDSNRKHNSKSHKSSRSNDKKQHSSHKSEKRKRKNDAHMEEPAKKVERRQNSTETLPKQSSPDDERDSDTCDTAAFALDDNEDEDDGKRLSVEEQLEQIHDRDIEDTPASASAPVLSKGKRRIAHDTPYISDHTMLRAKVSKVTPRTRPAERVATPAAPQEVSTLDSRAAALFGLNLNKPRIMAVPNAQRLLAEKSNLASVAGRLSLPIPTVAKTVAPGSKRMEHKPDGKDVLCPTVKDGSRSVAVPIRNMALKRLFAAYQFLPTKNEASEMALQVESKIFNDCKDNSKRYNMASVNAIMKAKRGYSKEKPTGPSELEFYELVQPHLLNEEQLVENGFPIEVEEGYASCLLNQEFKYNKKYRYIKDAFAKGERYCVRCSMTYKVDETTWEQTPIPDVCVFHADSGKKRVLGEVTHKCCGTPGPGCMSESLHITDLKDYERLPGCVKSEPKSPPEKYRRVLALDCEMVHTRLGVELAYIVVVDSSCSIVYESYCKPSREVECYNTTYSGITEEKLRNVTKSLSTVQRELLAFISDETILVGHSLDSDFRALHLIHGVVADTAYIFRVESPDGSFYKRRLKELAQTILGKIIQESEYGHSAAEDAAAAMSLLRHKVLSA